MIEKLLASKKKRGFIKATIQRIYFATWLLFQRKSQKKRIKQADRMMRLLNQASFKENPQRLFAYIRKIDPFVFEELLLLSLKYRGVKVIHNKRYTGDGGIDGILVLGKNKRYAIQAKRYKSYITASHVNDFKHSLMNKRCHGGFFIHCGKSGKGLYSHLDPSIHLISGSRLHQLLTDVM